MGMDDRIAKDRFAAVVAEEGWDAGERYLAEHHPEADRAACREAVRAELAHEARASLVVTIVAASAPVTTVACYYLFAKGLQPITGVLAYLMVLILIGLIGLGILGAFADHVRAKTRAR